MGKYSKVLADLPNGRKKCSYCDHEFNKQKDGNTNLFAYHLKTKHRKEWNKFKGNLKEETPDEIAVIRSVAASQRTIEESFATSLPESKSNQIHRATMQLIASAALPISFVDHPAWRNFCSVALPKFTCKSRHHFQRSQLPTVYEEYKKKLIADLKIVPSVALSFDGWTDSSNKHQYLGVLAHFVEEQHLSCRLLGAIDISQEKHTGDYLKRKLEEVIADFEINGKVCACVRDGAANAITAAQLLDYPHYDCLAHKINLAVGEGIDIFKNLQNVLGKIRKFSNIINKSCNKRREYMEVSARLNVPPLVLKKHVKVRWNTVHAVFERALTVRDTIDYLSAESSELPKLSETDWKTAMSVVEILQPIVDATLLIQNRGMTCSAIIPLCKVLIRELRENTKFRTFCSAMIIKLEEELKKYGKIDFLKFSMMLDVRFKEDYAEEGWKEKLLEKLLENRESVATIEMGEPISEKPKVDNPFSRFMKSKIQNIPKKSKVSGEGDIVEELTRWFQEGTDIDLNPIEYWNTPSKKGYFPHLYELYLKIFSAPATTAEAERLFSTAKTILADNRKLLSSDSFSKLLFIQQNVRFMGFSAQNSK